MPRLADRADRDPVVKKTIYTPPPPKPVVTSTPKSQPVSSPPPVKQEKVVISDSARKAQQNNPQPTVVRSEPVRVTQPAKPTLTTSPKQDTVQISDAAKNSFNSVKQGGTVTVKVADQGGAPGGRTSNPQVDKNKNPDFSVKNPREDKNRDPDYKPASNNNNGKTWGQAASEAAVSSAAGTATSTIFETGGKKVFNDPVLPGAIGKFAGLGMSTVDINNDMASKLSQGKTTFGSNKTVSQSVVEAGTGAIITELGTARVMTAAALAPETLGGSILALGAGYAISTVDSKLGVSAGVAEYAKNETNRVKQSGETIKELMDRGNKKGYGDMSDKEKQAIDKAMKNVTEQNDRIVKAKEKWIEADRRGDVAGKKAAENEANDAREKGGRIGRDHDIDHVKELNEKIEKAKDKWRDADNIKDPVEKQKAKDAAHEEANRYRSEGGTLG